MCIYIYEIYIYIYTYIYIYININISIYVFFLHIHVHMCIHMYVYVPSHMCERAYLLRECMIMTIPIQTKPKCDMKMRAFVVPEETHRGRHMQRKEQPTQIQGKKRQEKMKKRILTSPHCTVLVLRRCVVYTESEYFIRSFDCAVRASPVCTHRHTHLRVSRGRLRFDMWGG